MGTNKTGASGDKAGGHEKRVSDLYSVVNRSTTGVRLEILRMKKEAGELS
ncbi:hypothetical protein L6Q85_01855 [bacterium]|nr:hypothetical protein [bacterium]NUP92940.1 hypothetical protein [Candidatus Omnitrophota bacterium]